MAKLVTFQILCNNIRGATSKFRYFNGTKPLIGSSHFDIIALQETWASSDNFDHTDLYSDLNQEYDFSVSKITNSRSHNLSGTGMCILSDKSTCSKLQETTFDDRIQSVSFSSPALTVVNIYAPVWNARDINYDEFQANLTQTLENIAKYDPNIVVMGDFNKLPAKNPIVTDLCKRGFRLLTTSAGTHDSGKLLDYCLVSESLAPSTTINSQTLPSTTSDHDAFCITVTEESKPLVLDEDDENPEFGEKLALPKSEKEIANYQRDIQYFMENNSCTKIEALLADLSRTKRPKPWVAACIDRYLYTITSAIKYASNKMTRNQKSNGVNSAHMLYWDVEIDKEYKNLIKTKSLDLAEYKLLKRKFSRLLQTKKSLFLRNRTRDLLESFQNNIFGFYKKVARTMKKGSVKPPYRKYYEFLRNIFEVKTPYQKVKFRTENFKRLYDDEILFYMAKVNSGKASYKNIQIEHYRHVEVKYITNLFNLILCYGHIPEEMLKAQIKPLIKDSLQSSKEPSNWRPISLVHSLSKILEYIYDDKLGKETGENQFAYKAGKSTLECYSKFKSTVLEIKRKQGRCIVAYLDLSKAFDTLSFQSVLDIYKEADAPNYIQRSVLSFMSRGQLILTPRLIINPKRGIKQGGCVSPKLFTLAVDKFLEKKYKNIKIFGWADDFALCGSNVEDVQSVLCEFENFCKLHGLSPNASKTKIQLFSSVRCQIPPILYLCDKKLEIVKIFKYLGFQTDCLFSSDAHFKYVLSKFRKAVFLYRRVLGTKDETLLIKLLKTYTIPKLYGLEIISPSVVPRYEARFNYIMSIALQRNVASISEFLKENNDMSLRYLIEKANKRAKILFKN